MTETFCLEPNKKEGRKEGRKEGQLGGNSLENANCETFALRFSSSQSFCVEQQRKPAAEELVLGDGDDAEEN